MAGGGNGGAHTGSGGASSGGGGGSHASGGGNGGSTVTGASGGTATSSGGSSGAAGAGAGGSGTSSGGAAGANSSQDGGPINTSGHFYVSPSGTGSACSSSAPCAITQAQTEVRAAVKSSGSIIVELADGVYSLSAPLVFTAADSPSNGSPVPTQTPSGDAGAGQTVSWQAASGAHPVLSGATKLTGWAVSDASKNIYKATAPSTFVTRQLYVGGKIATRARSSQTIDRGDMNLQTNGWSFTNSALNFLNSLQNPARAEFDVIGSWTDRYSPIQSVANGTVTMAQPAWDQNTWGWDVIKCPSGEHRVQRPLSERPDLRRERLHSALRPANGTRILPRALSTTSRFPART